MSGETVIYISIYLLNPNSKSERDKYHAFYNADNNDADILFSPFMFPECMRDFIDDQGTIIALLPEDLHQRLQALEDQTVLPVVVCSKIENIIKYIEKYIEQYVGISVIFAENI
jgi:hypothetical protein